MMYRSLLLLLCAEFCLALPGFLTVGYGQGGDSLSSATGGQNYATHAGSGMYFLAGAIFTVSPTVPHRFEAQVGAGYLFQNDDHAYDGSISWSRIPLEALYYYHNTQLRFRMGWGATYHINGEVNSRGNLNVKSQVENTWGRIVSVEKIWTTAANETMSIGLRHTSINYRLTDYDNVVDGDAWSVTFTGFLF